MWVALIVRVLKEVHVFGRHEVVLLLLLGRTLLMLLRMKNIFLIQDNMWGLCVKVAMAISILNVNTKICDRVKLSNCQN